MTNPTLNPTTVATMNISEFNSAFVANMVSYNNAVTLLNSARLQYTSDCTMLTAKLDADRVDMNTFNASRLALNSTLTAITKNAEFDMFLATTNLDILEAHDSALIASAMPLSKFKFPKAIIAVLAKGDVLDDYDLCSLTYTELCKIKGISAGRANTIKDVLADNNLQLISISMSKLLRSDTIDVPVVLKPVYAPKPVSSVKFDNISDLIQVIENICNDLSLEIPYNIELLKIRKRQINRSSNFGADVEAMIALARIANSPVSKDVKWSQSLLVSSIDTILDNLGISDSQASQFLYDLEGIRESYGFHSFIIKDATGVASEIYEALTPDDAEMEECITAVSNHLGFKFEIDVKAFNSSKWDKAEVTALAKATAELAKADGDKLELAKKMALLNP